MNVTLRVRGQFGEDGPSAEDRGEAFEISRAEDEYWAAVNFYGYPGYYMVKLDWLMLPDTSGTYRT